MKNLSKRETSRIKSKLQPKAYRPAGTATLTRIQRAESVRDFIGAVLMNFEMEKIISLTKPSQ